MHRDAVAPQGQPGAHEPAAVRYDTPYTVFDVEERRCARGRYEPGELPDVPPEPGLVRLSADAVAPLLARADRWMFGSAPVTSELRDWLRLTPRHPRYAEDGLTDRALALSTVVHVVTFGLFVWFGALVDLEWLWWVGLVLTAVAFAYEHAIVKATDLSRVNRAFFTANGFVGIALFAFALVDLLNRGAI